MMKFHAKNKIYFIAGMRGNVMFVLWESMEERHVLTWRKSSWRPPPTL